MSDSLTTEQKLLLCELALGCSDPGPQLPWPELADAFNAHPLVVRAPPPNAVTPQNVHALLDGIAVSASAASRRRRGRTAATTTSSSTTTPSTLTATEVVAQLHKTRTAELSRAIEKQRKEFVSLLRTL